MAVTLANVFATKSAEADAIQMQGRMADTWVWKYVHARLRERSVRRPPRVDRAAARRRALVLGDGAVAREVRVREVRARVLHIQRASER